MLAEIGRVRELAEAVGPRAEGVADKKEYDAMTQTATPSRISVRGSVSASARYAYNLQLCVTPFARNSSKRNSIPPRHFFERFVSVPQTTLHPKRHRIFVEFTLTEIQKEILDTNPKDDTFTAIRCITVDAPREREVERRRELWECGRGECVHVQS